MGSHSTYNGGTQLHPHSSTDLYSMQQGQQQNIFNSTDLGLMNSSRDIKPMMGGLSGYNDMSWLNLDTSSALLSGSPNMHSYVPDLHSALNSAHPYEHFQLGLDDSTGMKSSSGSINALATGGNEMQSFLEPLSHNGLYGHDSGLLMNLDMTS